MGWIILYIVVIVMSLAGVSFYHHYTDTPKDELADPFIFFICFLWPLTGPIVLFILIGHFLDDKIKILATYIKRKLNEHD